MGDVESSPHGRSSSVEDSSDSSGDALVKRQGTVIQRHRGKGGPGEETQGQSPPSAEHQNHHDQQAQLVSALRHLNDSLMGLSKESEQVGC